MVRIFGDIPGVFIYFEDIVIDAKNFVELDHTLTLNIIQSKYNTGDILRFLWLVKYLARFILNLSKLTAELGNVTRLVFRDGLGCVLVQEGYSIAIASPTLTKSEKCAQIEKELLTIVFACQHFQFFYVTNLQLRVIVSLWKLELKTILTL